MRGSVVHQRTQSGTRGTAVRALATLAALALLVGVGWVGYYRVTYHTFAWWEPPPRLRYCGRDFQEGAHSSALPTGSWSYDPAFTVEPGGSPSLVANTNSPADAVTDRSPVHPFVFS